MKTRRINNINQLLIEVIIDILTENSNDSEKLSEIKTSIFTYQILLKDILEEK